MKNDKCSITSNEYIDFLTNSYLSYDDMYRHMVNEDTASRYQDTDENHDIEDMIEEFKKETEDMAEKFFEDDISNDDIDFEALINEYKNGGYDPYHKPIGVNLTSLRYQDDMSVRPNHRNVEEDRLDDDIDYMKGMYPSASRKIMLCIEEECDKLEYTGSCMFDEYPDRTNISRIIIRIYEKVRNMNVKEEDNKDCEVETNHYCYDRYCPNNRCVDCYEDGMPNWLYQMVQTMFYQEMVNRRRRYRYRRWR